MERRNGERRERGKGEGEGVKGKGNNWAVTAGSN